MADDDQLRDLFTALLAGDPGLIADPYPLYARLRAEAPVLIARDGEMAVVTRHRDVNEVYRNARRFLSVHERVVSFGDHLSLLSPEERALFDEIIAFERLFISRQRGEDHRRYRGAMHRAFTPRRIAELRASVQAFVDDGIEALERASRPDWMDFAYRVPLQVIMTLLGAPLEDAERVKRWGDSVLDTMNLIPIEPAAVRAGHARLGEYRDYARELVERNRDGADRTSLVGLLLDAEEVDQLSVEEVTATFLHLLFAGHETTANLIGSAVYWLLAEHAQWDRICADPALIPSAVEEALRFESPAQMLLRVAAEDDDLQGVRLSAGSRILMVNGAANRDGDVFAQPDLFDVSRSPNDHIALGKGLHFCLGASLARLEAQVVLETVTRRFPDLELAIDPADVRWNRAAKLRGIASLPVELGVPAVA